MYVYPAYLPYPTNITRGNLPVPNAAAINWPQAQFAAPFLPPGSPSTTPFPYFNPHTVTPYGRSFTRSRSFVGSSDDCDCGPAHDCGCSGLGDAELEAAVTDLENEIAAAEREKGTAKGWVRKNKKLVVASLIGVAAVALWARR